VAEKQTIKNRALTLPLKAQFVVRGGRVLQDCAKKTEIRKFWVSGNFQETAWRLLFCLFSGFPRGTAWW